MNARKAAARLPAHSEPAIDSFRAQHLALAQRVIDTGHGRAGVIVDESESPLAWLARRRGRNGRALIEAHQLQAGERLRGEFTRAQLMPRTTSNWASPAMSSRRNGSNSAGVFTETVITARQRVRHALDAAGPEFSGLLLDVCCFLKGLEDVERERAWPARSAKVILQMGLDRLARHYGFESQARGRERAAVRTWLADDAEFFVSD
jgi:hypothetical protein